MRGEKCFNDLMSFVSNLGMSTINESLYAERHRGQQNGIRFDRPSCR